MDDITPTDKWAEFAKQNYAYLALGAGIMYGS
jgi:hypothetical protein